MNFLLSLINAGDKGAVAETNFQRLDESLAFGLFPSLDLDGVPTALNGPPVAGAFVVGQFWVDAALSIWRCTVAGSPGTWVLWNAGANGILSGNFDDPNGNISPPNLLQGALYYK